MSTFQGQSSLLSPLLSSRIHAVARYRGLDPNVINLATRLLSRGAAITDLQHLLGHASVKTTEKAYAAFVKNERFKQTIDLLDAPVVPRLKVVK